MECATHRELFYNELEMLNSQKGKNAIHLTKKKYDEIIQLLEGSRCTKASQYARRYKVVSINGVKMLVRPQVSPNLIFHVTFEDVFDKLNECHIRTDHGKRDKMIQDLKTKYESISVEYIRCYLKFCQFCADKKANRDNKKLKTMIFNGPVIFDDYLARGHVNLIDMQSSPDGDYRFILHYLEHRTKHCVLRPLKDINITAIAEELIDIFSLMSVPIILHCDNVLEFTSKDLTDEIMKLWPEVKIVHGKAENGELPDTADSANQDIVLMISSRCLDRNTTNWAKELKYVQLQRNDSFHSGVRQTPFEATFGYKTRMGLKSTNIPAELFDQIDSEEDLERFWGESSKLKPEES